MYIKKRTLKFPHASVILERCESLPAISEDPAAFRLLLPLPCFSTDPPGADRTPNP